MNLPTQNLPTQDSQRESAMRVAAQELEAQMKALQQELADLRKLLRAAGAPVPAPRLS